MGDQHLSELCRGSEIEPVQLQLKKVAGDDATDVNERSDAATAYINGIWGYRDEDGRTAFHWAVALKNYTLARKLMNAPCNSPVLTEDNDSVTPFATACTVGAPEDFVAELFDRSVAAYEIFQQCPSLKNQKKEKPKLVPTATAVPSPETQTMASDPVASPPPPPLAKTAEELTLNHEDELGNTPLIHAVSRGHRHVVAFLLRKGADLCHQNVRGQTALLRAVSRGDQDLVEELVRASERINSGASKTAHIRWMNLQDYRGDSALFYASMENNEEVGRYLLHHGADRELRNKEGKQFWEV